MKLMEELFLNADWESGYGGKAWADICKGWTRLYNAHSDGDLIVAIDHIYDLQHNSDTVFNKVQSYEINRRYDWLKNALNLKAGDQGFI